MTEYCCKLFEIEFGIIIQKWNDDGIKEKDSVFRLGFEDHDSWYWSNPISFCPFCGKKLE